jgi:hypothetical protein
MTEKVNENSTSYITVNPKDKDGVAATPATLAYWIDCKTTGTSMKAETALTPGTSVEITIDADENAINDQANPVEVREVTVKAGYGSSDQVIEVFPYEVINLAFVS